MVFPFTDPCMAAAVTHPQGDGVNTFASPRNWRTGENIVWDRPKDRNQKKMYFKITKGSIKLYPAIVHTVTYLYIALLFYHLQSLIFTKWTRLWDGLGPRCIAKWQLLVHLTREVHALTRTCAQIHTQTHSLPFVLLDESVNVQGDVVGDFTRKLHPTVVCVHRTCA